MEPRDPAAVPAPFHDRRRRLLTLALLWVFALGVLLFFRSVVLPFAGAALIAYLVAPAVDWICRLRLKNRSLPRWVAILAIYTLFFIAIYLFVVGFFPQIYRELARISRDVIDWANSLTPERIREMAHSLENWFQRKGVPLELDPSADDPTVGSITIDFERVVRAALERIVGLLRENVGDIVGITRRVITGVIAGVFMLFFILMVAAFFSIDVRNIRRYFKTLVPPELAEDAGSLLATIDRSLAGVVRGQVTICGVNGALTFIGLLLFDIKFAALLATVATLFSLIPIFGTIISSVPIVLIGLSQSWKQGLAILIWIIGIHAIEAYFLNPKIMGTAAKIHPVVVAFSLIAGERTFGLVGALFAVPIAAVIVACFDFARRKAQPPPSAEAVVQAPPPAG